MAFLTAASQEEERETVQLGLSQSGLSVFFHWFDLKVGRDITGIGTRP